MKIKKVYAYNHDGNNEILEFTDLESFLFFLNNWDLSFSYSQDKEDLTRFLE